VNRAGRTVAVMILWPLILLAIYLVGTRTFRRGAPLVTPAGFHASPDSGLVSDLRSRFAQVNPRATHVWLLDVRSAADGPNPGAQYAALATAWDDSATAIPRPGGPFGQGELYGVFVVDSTLIHVVRTLQIFPTRRWHDYDVRFGEVSSDSIIVLGAGRTYGDAPMGLKFDWIGNCDSTFRWAPALRESTQD